MKLETICPTCWGKVPLEKFEGLDHAYAGKCPDCRESRLFDVIEENGKRILISGCSHKGIINICEWFRPDVVIGGFHFSKYPLDDELLKNAALLDSYNTVFYTCHCTGTEQFDFMKSKMKNLNYLSAGETIYIWMKKQLSSIARLLFW